MALKPTKQKQTIISWQFFIGNGLFPVLKKRVMLDSHREPLPSHAHSLRPYQEI